ncbi:hypothetical protein [Ramlibacter sp. Leaf400]|uniref:hypothetical protein n=1 Tax=Ramlibacter sp. Leaf400 TaxID=1736365 RepID=UPI00070190A0|nr:hypothetical protein [Ramlibacter sp. Leaf400]KQT10783.1 hypothetical protein ASG30_08200 [Ramlibacter sp. Leaf400]
MAWITPSLRNSLYGLLGHAQPSESLLDNRTEDIRESMLDLLGDNGARKHPNVIRRIRYASDVHSLWYLRGDLMAVLADVHGEAIARRQVRKLTDMFRGVLPGALTSRRSALFG